MAQKRIYATEVPAAAKARGATRARPASKGPAAAGPARPPPPKVGPGDASDTNGNSNPTVSSMIDEGDIDDMTPAEVREMLTSDETRQETKPASTPTQPESTGPMMLAHLLHPAPRPRRPAAPS